ncbi:MAG: hypothetical protein PVH37_27675 [Desulfobacterales bacterium]|jgi:hypothetical protein
MTQLHINVTDAEGDKAIILYGKKIDEIIDHGSSGWIVCIC